MTGTGIVRSNDDFLSSLAEDDADHVRDRADVSALATLNRSEVETQIDAAHKHKRSVKTFLDEAATIATLTREVAESCIYTLPRGGKSITGPSVRLAEIMASAYGNLHVAARVLDADAKEITAQGAAWDLQKNIRVTVEVRRRITKKDGSRFDDDMITVTGNAAASIALRNAIFRVIPRAYVDIVYAHARKVAVGDAKTLEDRRSTAFAYFAKLGITADRVLARLEKLSVDDVGLDGLEVLVGLKTAISNKDVTLDEAFPAPGAAKTAIKESTQTTKDLEAQLLAAKPATESPSDALAAEAAKRAANDAARVERETAYAVAKTPTVEAQATRPKDAAPVAAKTPTVEAQATRPKDAAPVASDDSDSLFGPAKPAAAAAQTAATPWWDDAEEVHRVKDTVHEGIDGKQRDVARQYLRSTLAGAPANVVRDLTQFWCKASGETKL